MKIYNSQGKIVRTIHEGIKAVGNYSSKWNGINDSGQQVSSGVYYVIMELPDRIISRKLVLIR